MQLNLFTEDTQEEIQREGTDTYFCRCCKKDLPEDSFVDSAIQLFNREKGQIQGAGTAVWCRECKKSYTKGKTIALKHAPLKPTTPAPCDCCGILFEPKRLYLDHDHKTFKFRGWVCRSCNSGIGMLGDDIEGLEQAIEYLKRHYERS
jgi:hypothetical protein